MFATICLFLLGACSSGASDDGGGGNNGESRTEHGIDEQVQSNEPAQTNEAIQSNEPTQTNDPIQSNQPAPTKEPVQSNEPAPTKDLIQFDKPYQVMDFENIPVGETFPSNPRCFEAYGDNTVFIAKSGSKNGTELWISDGTLENTRSLVDIKGSHLCQLKALGETLYFSFPIHNEIDSGRSFVGEAAFFKSVAASADFNEPRSLLLASCVTTNALRLLTA